MGKIDLTPPSTPPALGISAAKMYFAGGRVITPALTQQLEDELDTLRGDDNALFWALVSVEGVCQLLRQQGDAIAASHLTQFIKAQRDRYPDLEEAVLSLSLNHAEAANAQTSRALGVAPTKRQAPLFGAKEPQGSTKLSSLVPVSALQAARRR